MKPLLTIGLIARETLVLMGNQLRLDEPAFDANFVRSIRSFDLTCSIDAFSRKHLEEAADTLMCVGSFNAKAKPLRRPSADVDYAIERYRLITLRVIRFYDLFLDETRYGFDAQYRPEG